MAAKKTIMYKGNRLDIYEKSIIVNYKHCVGYFVTVGSYEIQNVKNLINSIIKTRNQEIKTVIKDIMDV